MVLGISTVGKLGLGLGLGLGFDTASQHNHQNRYLCHQPNSFSSLCTKQDPIHEIKHHPHTITTTAAKKDVQKRRIQYSLVDADHVGFGRPKKETETTIRRSRIMSPFSDEFLPRRPGCLVLHGDRGGMDFQFTGSHAFLGTHHDGPVDPFQLVHARAITPPEHDSGLPARTPFRKHCKEQERQE